jgi:hypothetical protein
MNLARRSSVRRLAAPGVKVRAAQAGDSEESWY